MLVISTPLANCSTAKRRIKRRLENWVNSNNTGNFRLDGIRLAADPRALTALPLNYARRLSNVFGDVALPAFSPPLSLSADVSAPCQRRRFQLRGQKEPKDGVLSPEYSASKRECKRTSRNVNPATFPGGGGGGSICLGALSVPVKRVYSPAPGILPSTNFRDPSRGPSLLVFVASTVETACGAFPPRCQNRFRCNSDEDRGISC